MSSNGDASLISQQSWNLGSAMPGAEGSKGDGRSHGPTHTLGTISSIGASEAEYHIGARPTPQRVAHVQHAAGGITTYSPPWMGEPCPAPLPPNPYGAVESPRRGPRARAPSPAIGAGSSGAGGRRSNPYAAAMEQRAFAVSPVSEGAATVPDLPAQSGPMILLPTSARLKPSSAVPSSAGDVGGSPPGIRPGITCLVTEAQHRQCEPRSAVEGSEEGARVRIFHAGHNRRWLECGRRNLTGYLPCRLRSNGPGVWESASSWPAH